MALPVLDADGYECKMEIDGSPGSGDDDALGWDDLPRSLREYILVFLMPCFDTNMLLSFGWSQAARVAPELTIRTAARLGKTSVFDANPGLLTNPGLMSCRTRLLREAALNSSPRVVRVLRPHVEPRELTLWFVAKYGMSDSTAAWWREFLARASPGVLPGDLLDVVDTAVDNCDEACVEVLLSDTSRLPGNAAWWISLLKYAANRRVRNVAVQNAVVSAFRRSGVCDVAGWADRTCRQGVEMAMNVAKHRPGPVLDALKACLKGTTLM